jgi:hypothetical protein
MRWLGSKGQISSVQVDGLADLEKPLRLELAYSVPAAAHEAGDDLVLRAPATWESSRISVSAVHKKKHPFEVRFPFSIQSTTAFDVPKGRTAVPPAERAASPAAAPFAAWTFSPSTSAATVKVELMFERRPGRHRPEAFAVFHRENEAALELLEQPILFRRGK